MRESDLGHKPLAQRLHYKKVPSTVKKKDLRLILTNFRSVFAEIILPEIALDRRSSKVIGIYRREGQIFEGCQ